MRAAAAWTTAKAPATTASQNRDRFKASERRLDSTASTLAFSMVAWRSWTALMRAGICGSGDQMEDIAGANALRGLGFVVRANPSRAVDGGARAAPKP